MSKSKNLPRFVRIKHQNTSHLWRYLRRQKQTLSKVVTMALIYKNQHLFWTKTQTPSSLSKGSSYPLRVSVVMLRIQMIYYLLSILCSKNTRVSKISLAHLLSLRLEWKSLVATKIPHSFPYLTKTILVVLLAVYRKLSSATRLAKLVCSVTDAPPVFLSPTSQTLFSLCCNSHK